MCETIFFPDYNVPEAAVTFILSHTVSQSLIEDIIFLSIKFPFHSAVQIQASIGQRRTLQMERIEA